jgi:hypothetical protein
MREETAVGSLSKRHDLRCRQSRAVTSGDARVSTAGGYTIAAANGKGKSV